MDKLSFPTDTIGKIFQQDVINWHREEPELTPTPDNDSLLNIARQFHLANFKLWHQEDLARSQKAPLQQIVDCKRNIDRYNQYRNDHIEKWNQAFAQQLSHFWDVMERPDLPLRSETPGSILDRISILSLKEYHLLEQAEDLPPAEAQLRQFCKDKSQLVMAQQVDLHRAFTTLIEEVVQHKARFKLYYQVKMYNDARLNPVLRAEKTN